MLCFSKSCLFPINSVPKKVGQKLLDHKLLMLCFSKSCLFPINSVPKKVGQKLLDHELF